MKAGLLHTYEVICASCRKPKWPTLPFRPAAYVCALCTVAGTEKRAARVAEAARRRKSSPSAPQRPTEGKWVREAKEIARQIEALHIRETEIYNAMARLLGYAAVPEQRHDPTAALTFAREILDAHGYNVVPKEEAT